MTVSGLTVLGIRHLSPACARHLCCHIRETRPDVLLLEAPEDMGAFFLCPEAYPAVLTAYAAAPPRRPLRLPLAVYSPEVAALRVCEELDIPARCIDLPSAAWTQPGMETEEDAQSAFLRFALARGEECFDDAWERAFEHDERDFWERTLRFGCELRENLFRSEAARRREAYMLDRIAAAKREGFANILCVCGAYHAPPLSGLCAPEAPAQPFCPRDLPEMRVTVLPLGEQGLSSGGGYGGGNRSPAYHQLLWEDPERAAARFLTLFARALRTEGSAVGTEDIQSALRLAGELAAFRNGAVILRDLRDAAALCFAAPDAVFARVFTAVSVGDRQGRVAPDAPSPLCADITEALEHCRLTAKLHTGGALRLRLSAPLDRRRSHTLWRLHALALGLCEPEEAPFASEGANERWRLAAEPSWASRALLCEGDTLAEAAALRIAGEGNAVSADPLDTLSRFVLCGLPYAAALDALENAVRANGSAELFVRVTLRLDAAAEREEDKALAVARARFFKRASDALCAAVREGDEAARVRETLFANLHRVSSRDTALHDYWRVWLCDMLTAAQTPLFARGLCLSLWLDAFAADDAPFALCFDLAFGGAPADSPCFMEGLLRRGRLRVLRDTRLWTAFGAWLEALSEYRFERLRPALFAAFYGLEAEEKEALRVYGGTVPPPAAPPAPDAALLELLRGLSSEP